MLLTQFRFEDLDQELPAIRFEDGTWYFSAQETCVFSDIARPENAARWVRSNIPLKWIREIKTPGDGRPGLYLSKPGFYFAVCQGKSEQAVRFRDWVFEEVLGKIEANGGFIMPTVSDCNYALLKNELEEANPKMAYLEALVKLRELQGDLKVASQLHQALNSWDFRLNQSYQREWYWKTLNFYFQQQLKAMQSVETQKTLIQQLAHKFHYLPEVDLADVEAM